MNGKSISTPSAGRGHWDQWFLAGLLLLTFAIYLGSLPKEFTNYDDPRYIVANPYIKSFNLQNLRFIATNIYFYNYAPLTLFSYAVDYYFWGLNANAYHVVNVVLHLLCVVLVYWILAQFSLNRPAVYLITALFALHPTSVESVSWASERKNLLAALFFFASFRQYIAYSRDARQRNYLLSILFLLFSLLSKASTVVAPAVFLAYDYCQGKKKIAELKLLDKIPYIVMAEILVFWTLLAAQTDKSLHSYHSGGPLLSLLSVGDLLERYLCLLFWPANLTPKYVVRAMPGFADLSLWFAALVLFLLIYLVFKYAREISFGLLFFLIFMLPVMNLIPLPIKMANRYLYIAQFGFWLFFCQAWITGTAKFSFSREVRAVLFFIGILWLGILALYCYQTTGIWRNSKALFSYALEKDPDNTVAHYNLGEHLFSREGKYKQAAVHWMDAISISPQYHLPYHGLGIYFAQKKNFQLAEENLQKSINNYPEYDVAINDLGKIHLETGDHQRALYFFYRATYVNPYNLDAWDNLCQLHLRYRQHEALLAASEQIIHLFPESPLGYKRLTQSLEGKGDSAGALQAWQEYKKRGGVP